MNKKNLANAQLLNSIDASSATITVKQNQGEALPATPFFATLTPLGVLSTIDNSEIVQVTARTGDVLTVTRAQRDTTAKEFQAESILANSVYVEDFVDTTYTEITEAEITAGTSSTLRTITGRRVGFLKRLVVGVSYPVGSLYFNADDGTNPGTLLGVGTWEAYAEGRVPVGKSDSGTFSVAGGTMGAETHTLTVDELAPHLHGRGTITTGTAGAHTHTITSWSPRTGAAGGGSWFIDQGSSSNGITHSGNSGVRVNSSGTHFHSVSGNTANAGGGGAHNNIQPSVVVYIWRRVS